VAVRVEVVEKPVERIVERVELAPAAALFRSIGDPTPLRGCHSPPLLPTSRVLTAAMSCPTATSI
jgi:hypothetical protein